MKKQILVLVAVLLAAGAASADTLERVRESESFRIGFREDAAPFAYRNDIGEPDGYSVELCRMVARDVKEALGLAAIEVEYVAVTAEDRFDAVSEGKVDILCGPTSATLSRRGIVDFSIPTFVDGASVLYRADGPATFDELAGHEVGVRGGTTTEEALRNTLSGAGIDAEIVAVESHDEGLSRLEAGAISAYFADHALLLYMHLRSDDPDALRLSSRHFTREPYALALARGDDDFRLLVDKTLSRAYRSGAVHQVFAEEFGAVEPGNLVIALWVVSALPE